MRLKKEVVNYIKSLALEIFSSKNIWLFGSRVDNSLKGGDIDIYIETDRKSSILASKIEFLREFEKRFGEQKVDLVINNFTKTKPIFQKAKESGVKL
jgi:predicted nucleotidyltransferase